MYLTIEIITKIYLKGTKNASCFDLIERSDSHSLYFSGQLSCSTAVLIQLVPCENVTRSKVTDGTPAEGSINSRLSSRRCR